MPDTHTKGILIENLLMIPLMIKQRLFLYIKKIVLPNIIYNCLL